VSSADTSSSDYALDPKNDFFFFLANDLCKKKKDFYMGLYYLLVILELRKLFG